MKRETIERMTTNLRGAFFPLLLLSIATISGCGTSSGGRLLPGGAAAGPQGAADYIAALQGGLVSRNAAAKLSTADQNRALEAEYRALEGARGGQPVVWQGRGGVSGSVVAAAPYQVGSQNCRQYSHTLTVDGRETATRGAACRNADGTWAPLS